MESKVKQTINKQELQNQLKQFLIERGTDAFAMLISDSIDRMGPIYNKNIAYYHKAISKTLLQISETTLLSRVERLKPLNP